MADRSKDQLNQVLQRKAPFAIITAPNRKWARQAAISMTGYATSVIGCGCEAAIDVELPASATPDGRPGCRVMMFAIGTDELQKQLQNRVGQCVLTSPGSACFAGLDGAVGSSSALRCAISAMAGRSPRNWAAAISGGSRSWTGSSCARRRQV